MCADARTSSRAGPLRPPPRARRLRRGVRRARQGAALARDRAAGAAGAHQPAAPRRVRLRGQHRRRRRHSDPDAGPVPAPRDGAARHRAPARAALRRRVRVPAARRRPARPRSRRSSSASSSRKGSSVLGWRDVPTDDAAVGPSAVAVEPVFRQLFIGRGPMDGDRRRRRRAVRAEALRDPQARRACRRRDGARRPERVLRAEPVVADADLQGHAQGGPDRADVPRSGGSGRRVGAGAGAPAVQHQHVPVLAAGASLPLRRAQRRDQHAARQHQLDAGARGAARVRRARRRPARRSCRSSAKGAATPRSSTTCSSSSSWRAARCRTPC